jgi:hypothetical protein
MPTYKVQWVRTYEMFETLTIRTTSPEAIALHARVQVTPLDTRRLYKDRISMYLVKIVEVIRD